MYREPQSGARSIFSEARTLWKRVPTAAICCGETQTNLKKALSCPQPLMSGSICRLLAIYLSGVLPETATETDFMRRYEASRHLVLATLALMAEEGIVHRGKGREWRFREVLKSSRSREASYELRLMVEPNAVLLPTFKIVIPELEQMRALQQKLVNTAAELLHREVFISTRASTN